MFLIREAIETNIEADIRVIPDGERAIQFFDEMDRDASVPSLDLVILDINLPKKQGGQVLSHMRQSSRCAGVLVVIVTSSNSARDREEMQKSGANAYFRKPSDYTDFMKLGEVVETLLADVERSHPCD